LVLFQPYVLFAITLSLDTLVYIPMAVCFWLQFSASEVEIYGNSATFFHPSWGLL
jgi:hypothetical protein